MTDDSEILAQLEETTPDGVLQEDPQELEIMRRLSEPLSQALEAITQEDGFRRERLAHINRAKLYWHYVKGNHYIAPAFSEAGGTEIVDFEPIDLSGEGERFAYPVNVIGGDCWKFVSVTGQALPTIKAVPDDIESQQDIQTAKMHDASIRDLWQKWDLRYRAPEISFHQYTTGPVFGYTPVVTDAQRFGTRQEEILTGFEPVPTPDGGMVQQPVTQTIDLPNADVDLHMCNILHVMVPFGTRSLSECDWLWYEYMESKYKLIAKFGKKLRLYKNFPLDLKSGVLSTEAAEAASSVSNATGKSQSLKGSHWEYRQIWLQPQMYESISDKDVRAFLAQKYPDGLKLTLVKDWVVQMDNQRLTDYWAVCKTGRGEFIMEAPVCHDIVPIQKALNSFVSIAIETLLRAVPKTIVDQSLIDIEKLVENSNLAVELLPTKVPAAGMDLRNAMVAMPQARFSEQMVPFGELLRKYSQDIGIRPEITGGGETTNTYREARQRRDQALMQLAPALQEQKRFLEKVSENASNLRAKFGTGMIKAISNDAFGDQSAQFSMAEMPTTGWHCEAEEGLPMSWADRADRLAGYFQEWSPEAQNALGLFDPTNSDKVHEFLGIPGFKSSPEYERQKVMDRIGRLVKETPIPGMGPDGMPIDQPSVMPEPFVDDFGFCAAVVKTWCNSPAGRRAQAQTPDGYRNVVLHGMEQEKMAQMMAAPPPGAPPPQEGGPPPGGPGPGPKGPPQPDGQPPIPGPNVGGEPPVPPPVTGQPPSPLPIQ